MKNKGPPDLLHMSCSLLIGPLELRVEIFASLQGSSQYCSLWVDPHVLLRPAEKLNLRLTESLQQLRECWSGGGLGVPGTEDQGMHIAVNSTGVYSSM